MTHKLVLRQYIDLPFHAQGDFDHGDVALSNGYVFIANTAAAPSSRRWGTPAPPGDDSRLSGGQRRAGGTGGGPVFAAARGAGKLLVIDTVSTTIQREVTAGSRPNGLAWDLRRKHLLVADVQDNTARLVDPQAGAGDRNSKHCPAGHAGRV